MKKIKKIKKIDIDEIINKFQINKQIDNKEDKDNDNNINYKKQIKELSKENNDLR